MQIFLRLEIPTIKSWFSQTRISNEQDDFLFASVRNNWGRCRCYMWHWKENHLLVSSTQNTGPENELQHAQWGTEDAWNPGMTKFSCGASLRKYSSGVKNLSPTFRAHLRSVLEKSPLDLPPYCRPAASPTKNEDGLSFYAYRQSDMNCEER